MFVVVVGGKFRGTRANYSPCTGLLPVPYFSVVQCKSEWVLGCLLHLSDICNSSATLNIWDTPTADVLMLHHHHHRPLLRLHIDMFNIKWTSISDPSSVGGYDEAIIIPTESSYVARLDGCGYDHYDKQQWLSELWSHLWRYDDDDDDDDDTCMHGYNVVVVAVHCV